MHSDPAPTRDLFEYCEAASRGFRHAYLRGGSGGEALVLLHDARGDARRWQAFLPGLIAAGFDVIAPDARGRGRSSGRSEDPVAEPGPIATHAADLYALLHGQLGLERVWLAGVGWGGELAQHLCLRFPGFVCGLALAGAPLAAANETLTWILYDADDPELPADYLERATRMFPHAAWPQAWKGARGFLPALAPELFEKNLIEHFSPPLCSPQAEDAYVSLGSNLGAREQQLCAAYAALRRSTGVEEVVASPVYETDPVGPGEQGAYLNAVARVRSTLTPRALLRTLLEIEKQQGRTRGATRNSARTLDLDLLLFGQQRIDTPELVVPHPRLSQRPFVLEPLRQLAPDLQIPGERESVAALAERHHDPAAVRLRST